MEFTEGRKLLILVAICGVLAAQTHAKSFEVKPESVAVEHGSEAVFHCKMAGLVEDGLRWTRRVGLSDQDEKIYDSFPKGIGPVDPVKYNVTLPEPHTSTLVVNNVLLEDGGTYKCGAILATEMASDAHLIVAAKPYVSTSNPMTAGNNGTLMCDFAYGAHGTLDQTDMVPVMTVKIGQMVLEANITKTKQTIGDPTNKISFFKLQTMSTKHHGQNFTCTVNIATNPPFEISSSKLLEVNFPPTKPVITPNKHVFYAGDIINCTSEGFPEPTISWIPEIGDGGNIKQGSLLEVTSAMLGNNTWRCKAESPSNLKVETRFSFEVVQGTAPPVGESKDNTVAIAVGVAVPAAIIIVIVVVVCIVCSKKKSGGGKPQAPAGGESGTRRQQPRDQIYKPVSTKPEGGEVRFQTQDEKASYKPGDQPKAAPRRETVKKDEP